MKTFINKHWVENKQAIMLACMAFLFAAGVIQYVLGLTYVLALTPITLAVLCVPVLMFWDCTVRTKAVIFAAAVLAGYFMGIIGVHMAFLFGHYNYGSVLGFKAWGVPLIIGTTWFLVTLSAWHIVALGKLSTVQRFLLAGALVVMFDLVFEQFAVAYGLWAWRSAAIPLLNYVSWFFVGEAYFFAYYHLTKKAEPSIFVAGLLPLTALFLWLMLVAQ